MWIRADDAVAERAPTRQSLRSAVVVRRGHCLTHRIVSNSDAPRRRSLDCRRHLI